MAKFEISIKNQAGVIEWNQEELKKELSDTLSIYKEMQIDETNKAEGKRVVADLRKLETSVKDRVKDIKKEFMKPFDAFKVQADEICLLIQEPVGFINNQVLEFEDNLAKQKRIEIRTIFDDAIGNLEDIVSLDSIYNPKWDNLGTTIKAITTEVITKIASINQGIGIINMNTSDAKEKAMELFLNNYDIGQALTYIQEYEAKRLEIMQREEGKRKAEEEKRRIEEEAAQERTRQRDLERVRREEREKYDAETKQLRDLAEAQRKAAEAMQYAKEQEELAKQQALINAALEQEVEVAKELGAYEVIEAMTIQERGSEDEVYLVTYTFNLTSLEMEQVELYFNSIGLEYMKGE